MNLSKLGPRPNHDQKEARKGKKAQTKKHFHAKMIPDDAIYRLSSCEHTNKNHNLKKTTGMLSSRPWMHILFKCHSCSDQWVGDPHSMERRNSVHGTANPNQILGISMFQVAFSKWLLALTETYMHLKQVYIKLEVCLSAYHATTNRSFCCCWCKRYEEGTKIHLRNNLARIYINHYRNSSTNIRGLTILNTPELKILYR